MALIITRCLHQLEHQSAKEVDLKIENGKIVQIQDHITPDPKDEVVDGKGYHLAPGFVDVHVHLREPGGEHKETIKTGTKAAARGGYTTIAAMPNTNPVPDNNQTINQIREKIKRDASIDVLLYGSITKELDGERLVDFDKIDPDHIMAFTDDGKGIQTSQKMLDAMKKAKKMNKAIVAHCEDNTLINNGCVHQGSVSERLGVNGIPSICESTQIARDVLLAEATNCHYHVCHVSTKESVRVIRDAKKAGIHVTAEVSPHHLLLNEDDIKEKDTDFKMNPPLRSKQDQEALLKGLKDGTIDFIATDHAPHAKDEKDQPIEKAPFGIVGLETAFSLLYTHLVLKNHCTLSELYNWLSEKPANTFGLNKGTIEEGVDADLVLLDLEKNYTIDRTDFKSKGQNTPFHRWEVTGQPILTLCKGKIAYQEGN
ncbi:dihydroorotase [Pelagirhabdus alkalitolerans]|uniref:Dihydroorotase n=1 Tax=Pelagirhabdus alkalitolerans TaxID=1612202 RepID=A0A1G6H140_9BACI|nr:dihydroorotase [Pelagirhabdus alkalitolerans]SDB87863.1 dihydroorotase [Pelagirhabdus alkalitolerans]